MSRNGSNGSHPSGTKTTELHLVALREGSIGATATPLGPPKPAVPPTGRDVISITTGEPLPSNSSAIASTEP